MFYSHSINLGKQIRDISNKKDRVLNKEYTKYNKHFQKIIDIIKHNKRTGIRRFDNKDLIFVLKYCRLSIPLNELIKYGNKCKWTTSRDKPFYNIGVFCKFFNDIYVKEKYSEDDSIYGYLNPDHNGYN